MMWKFQYNQILFTYYYKYKTNNDSFNFATVYNFYNHIFVFHYCQFGIHLGLLLYLNHILQKYIKHLKY